MSNNFPGFPHSMDFPAFSYTMGMGKKTYTIKCMITNFLGSLHTIDFVAFYRAMGNQLGNPCNTHMIKYNIALISDGKKALIILEKYEYQFSRFFLYDVFCSIFPYYEKLMCF